jgi:hypothetical protein
MVAPVESMARYPIEVTPTALHSNIRLVNTPGFVGRLKMTAQPLFQFGTITLHPTPDRRVIRLQTALSEQLFDVAKRERVAKILAHGAQNQLRCRLPPLEDCRSGCVLRYFQITCHPRQSCNTSVNDRKSSLSFIAPNGASPWHVRVRTVRALQP